MHARVAEEDGDGVGAQGPRRDERGREGQRQRLWMG